MARIRLSRKFLRKLGNTNESFSSKAFSKVGASFLQARPTPPRVDGKHENSRGKSKKTRKFSEKTPRTCKISRSPSWTGARQQTIPRHLCFSPRNGRNPAVHIVSGSKVKRKLGANSEKGRKESWGLPKRKVCSSQSTKRRRERGGRPGARPARRRQLIDGAR